MRAIIMLFGLCVLIAVPSSSYAAKRRHPLWMEGYWDVRSASTVRSDFCQSSDEAVSYNRLGKWVGMTVDDGGRWWIEGDRLIEVTDDVGEGGSPSDKGAINVVQFHRVREDELVGRNELGPLRMVRCHRDIRRVFSKR